MNRRVWIGTLLILGLASCKAEVANEESIPQKQTPIDGVRIAWDNNSTECIAPQGGYPRLRRLQDQSLIVVYDGQRNVMMRRSYDDGKTWTQPQAIFTYHSQTNDKGESCEVNMANAEIYQLSNGDLIAGCNYRPCKEGIVPYAIAIKRSKDNGSSWQETQVLYTAGTIFGDGCWEPSFLELPNGDVHIYFANEGPYRQSDEQEISVLVSSDKGENWSTEAKKVCFRGSRRDGMPVATLIDDKIVVVIEDNNIDQFKPYTVRTNIDTPWDAPILANSEFRSYALQEKLPDAVYAGAPYLLKLPSGETLLSYQTTGGRTNDWEKSTMEVAIGNKEARSFTKLSRPFNVPLNCEAKWNSLALFNDYQVAALASTNFNSPHIGVWMKKGYILQDITLPQNSYTPQPLLFVGEQGDTQAQGYVAETDKGIKVRVDVSDPTRFGTQRDKCDAVTISIDSQNDCYSTPAKGVYRFTVTHDNRCYVEQGDSSHWKSIATTGVEYKAVETSNGYTVNMLIPFDVIKKENRSAMRINLTLSAYQSEYVGYKESLPHTNEQASNTWIRVDYKN